MLSNKWVQKLRNSPLLSSPGWKSALRSVGFHPEDRHSKFLWTFGTLLAGTMGSNAISIGFTSTRNSNPTSESPSGETQTLRQSTCSEKLKCYLRVTATRTQFNSNPTSESPQRETQILLQSHCHKYSIQLKSHYRVTTTENSNPTSESTPQETGILFTFIL
jgi:hypothetical protein